VFEEWRVESNKAVSDDGELCPSNLLECPTLYQHCSITELQPHAHYHGYKL